MNEKVESIVNSDGFMFEFTTASCGASSMTRGQNRRARSIGFDRKYTWNDVTGGYTMRWTKRTFGGINPLLYPSVGQTHVRFTPACMASEALFCFVSRTSATRSTRR